MFFSVSKGGCTLKTRDWQLSRYNNQFAGNNFYQYISTSNSLFFLHWAVTRTWRQSALVSSRIIFHLKGWMTLCPLFCRSSGKRISGMETKVGLDFQIIFWILYTVCFSCFKKHIHVNCIWCFGLIWCIGSRNQNPAGRQEDRIYL